MAMPECMGVRWQSGEPHHILFKVPTGAPPHPWGGTYKLGGVYGCVLDPPGEFGGEEQHWAPHTPVWL